MAWLRAPGRLLGIFGRTGDAVAQVDVYTPSAPQLSVPPVIPAWKGKATLREAGLLDAVEAAVLVAGGRVQDAWTGASEWSRGSDFLLSLASRLGLTKAQIDEMFRSADSIQS